MSERKPTPSAEQTRAIKERGINLLVSAAAGSGKTYTLVERIIANIIAGTYDIDEVLVVTFTNAAAAEMRERIEKRLTAKIEDDPGLERQLALLSNASISTIHVFCLSLIRQHFAALDIDPGFRVGSEQEMTLLRQRVVEDLFEACYEAGDEAFLHFAAQYGSDRDDEKLHGMILRLYDFARSQPNPKAWLEKQPELFAGASGRALEALPWYQEIRGEISRTLTQAAQGAARLLRQVEAVGAEELLPAIASDAEQITDLQTLLAKGDWAAMGEAVRAVAYQRQPRAQDVDKAFKEFISEYRKKEIKDRLAYLKDTYFSEEAETLLTDLQDCHAPAAVMCRLAAEFGTQFWQAKRKKRLVDFDDLEHLALRLLEREDVAQEMRGRYREVMIDEYQDVNGVQEAILNRMTNGRNLFAVGDVKQSIYRFRLADPGLFQEKHRSYGAEENGDSAAIDMKENYRSRPEVLAAVNYVFSQVMVSPELELTYDENAALYAKAYYPAHPDSFEGDAADLYILETGALPAYAEAEEKEDSDGEDAAALTGFSREAAFIAEKVRALHDAGRQVYDKEEQCYRPLRWRDIVVLLRSAKGKAQPLVEAFRTADVPAYAAIDGGYFAEVEVGIVLALLSVIDNAHQDIPLAAVLHSPIVGMKAEELAQIRADAPEGDFFTAVASSESEKAADFLARLCRWRTLSRRVGVPELIWQLYRETGYYDYVGAQPGGLVRQANLRMLSDRAADYERTNFRGLFRFLQFIRQMRDRDTDLSAARTLGEKEDVVRVMTVHKSKGLEFPVVILADLGKAFNMQDIRSELLIHRTLGLGLFKSESDGVIAWRYPTLARQAVASRLKREGKAEELRALYVAMTRAREKLILVGSVPSLPKRAMKWCRPLATPTTAISGADALEASNWLDWVAMAVARHRHGGAEIREAAGEYDAPAIPYDGERFGVPRWQVQIVLPMATPSTAEPQEEGAWLQYLRRREPFPRAADDERVARLSWQYPYPAEIPAKITVTEWKRRQSEEEENVIFPAAFRGEATDFLPPAFLREAEEKPSGAAYGTLMHDVLQRLDFSRAGDLETVRAQIHAMTAAGHLTAEEAKAVRVEALTAFLTSPLGQRVRRAKTCWKEQSFGLLLSAREVAPEAAEEDEVYVQGVIDLFFEEQDGGIVLLDYKTDRGTTPDLIRRRYQAQMALYARAIQRILGKAPKEIYIYRLFDGDAVDMTPMGPISSAASDEGGAAPLFSKNSEGVCYLMENQGDGRSLQQGKGESHGV
ncbi:MAG: helicase-exonuclease AddAB subunit AddA [Schwartzia sp. (in: firmicutes)]